MIYEHKHANKSEQMIAFGELRNKSADAYSQINTLLCTFCVLFP